MSRIWFFSSFWTCILTATQWNLRILRIATFILVIPLTFLVGLYWLLTYIVVSVFFCGRGCSNIVVFWKEWDVLNFYSLTWVVTRSLLVWVLIIALDCDDITSIITLWLFLILQNIQLFFNNSFNLLSVKNLGSLTKLRNWWWQTTLINCMTKWWGDTIHKWIGCVCWYLFLNVLHSFLQ